MFYPNCQKIGDIILVQNKSSLGIRVGQSKISPMRIGTYTHVILCLQPGTYIEAMTSKGRQDDGLDIDLICYEELLDRFNSQYSSNWQVIRNKKLTDDLRGEIVSKASFYYGQNYNVNFFVKMLNKKHRDDASYCSELVSRIFSDIGFSLSDKDVWPDDIASLASEADWQNVTEYYKQKAEIFFDDSMCLLMKAVFRQNLSVAMDIVSLKSNINKLIEALPFLPNVEKNKLYEEYIGEKNFYHQYVWPLIHIENDEVLLIEKNLSWVQRKYNRSIKQSATYEERAEVFITQIDLVAQKYLGLSQCLTSLVENPRHTNFSIPNWYDAWASFLSFIDLYMEEDLSLSSAKIDELPNKILNRSDLKELFYSVIDRAGFFSELRIKIEPMISSKNSPELVLEVVEQLIKKHKPK